MCCSKRSFLWETLDECYDFFEDLCTMKELADMVQRVEAAKMLLSGNTYEQIDQKCRDQHSDHQPD